MPKLPLDRAQIAKIAGGVPQTIFALEQVLSDVAGFPSTIEEANALAGSALSIAQTAMAALAILADAVAQMESLPAPTPQIEPDDLAPRAHLGTISGQDADNVGITGGTVDGTPVGATVAAAGKFTTLQASGPFTSTVADGIAPLIITSTTLVQNLYVARAVKADSAGAAATADRLTNPTTYPPAATDAASTQTLVNALRQAAINKGL